MTTAPDVAVVATQLARTDRRALSQAWYSALHLAHDDASARPTHGATRRPPTAANGAPRAAANAAARSTIPAPRPASAHASRAASPAVERRSATDVTARRVERAIARLTRTAGRRPSHTVAIDGGRVTLLVRSDAHATRIVAVCSEPLRATVERALAHARYALATVAR